MKLQQRNLDLMADASELRTTAAAADETTRRLEAEIARRDDELAAVKSDLRATRDHAARQEGALSAAREREVTEHRVRVESCRRQLHELQETVGTQMRVDMQTYVEAAEPIYKVRLRHRLLHPMLHWVLHWLSHRV